MVGTYICSAFPTGPSASKDMDGKITATDLLRVFPEMEAEEVAETSWQKVAFLVHAAEALYQDVQHVSRSCDDCRASSRAQNQEA